MGWRFLLCAAEITDAGEDEATRETAAADPAGTVASGGAAVGAAEAVLTADGWTFGHFREGPYVTSTEHALRQAEALAGAYQPRLLSVPQLYMLTLWLHGEVGADAADGVPAPADVLIPLAPAPPGIAAHRPHRADALLPLLTRRATPVPLLTGTVTTPA